MANVTPIFKKGSQTKKEIFWPVSILPVVSKNSEKLISKQSSIFFENILSKFQCGFRKGYCTQQCLLLMLDKWKLAVDNDEVFGALLIYSSKAFDCLSHDLLIAKLYSYGLSLESLGLLSDCLSNCKQRIAVENVFSKRQNIETGILQRLLLGPILFNIIVCDLFLIYDNAYFTSCAGDILTLSTKIQTL